eukprot:TRINITY_DN11850_c1_g2_i1.p2 TRINITY_DN11850_c1_g2~~TRINITY_DN11850_c1_g2_i1.p2  ORF type:complete len:272 (+),score=61.47 TRINITY_DN11850_c1_g2_i1:289-1104(+)
MMLGVPGGASASPGYGQAGQSTSPAPSSASTAGRPRIITYTPTKLSFPPPLDRVLENRMLFQNPSPSCVAWKLLSSSPHRYAVTPTQGFLHPLASQEVIISYKPRRSQDGGKEDPADLINEHFKICAKIANISDENNLPELFKREDSANPRMSYKIRCIFAPGALVTPSGSLSRSPARVESLTPGGGETANKRLAQLNDERGSLERSLAELQREVVRAKTEESRLRSDLGSTPAAQLPLEIPLPLAIFSFLLAFFTARVVCHMAEELIVLC